MGANYSQTSKKSNIDYSEVRDWLIIHGGAIGSVGSYVFFFGDWDLLNATFALGITSPTQTFIATQAIFRKLTAGALPAALNFTVDDGGGHIQSFDWDDLSGLADKTDVVTAQLNGLNGKIAGSSANLTLT